MKIETHSPTVISASIPDWSREAPRMFFDPSRKLLRSIRRYQWWSAQTGVMRLAAIVAKKRWVFSHRFWSIVSAADIPLTCQIEGGLILPHPSGVVVHPDAKIGPNCLLGAHTVIGVGKVPGLPVLEGHVDVHAGGCVLGGVTVGCHSQVGANAVVIKDVPANATAVGVPARVILRSKE
ncbi:MAG: serine acetyltransferase [Rubripirellula sp.]